MTITRSTGLYTGIGSYFCGNGYEGTTKELDDTVKKQADRIEEISMYHVRYIDMDTA